MPAWAGGTCCVQPRLRPRPSPSAPGGTRGKPPLPLPPPAQNKAPQLVSCTRRPQTNTLGFRDKCGFSTTSWYFPKGWKRTRNYSSAVVPVNFFLPCSNTLLFIALKFWFIQLFHVLNSMSSFLKICCDHVFVFGPDFVEFICVVLLWELQYMYPWGWWGAIKYSKWSV